MNPLRVDGERCKHPRFVVDAEDRSVHCSTCGVVFDAFDVLLDEAERYKREEGFLAQARGELAHLYQQIDEQQKALRRTRKSVDNENRKLNRLIARRKALEGEVAVAEREHAEGSLQLSLVAAEAAQKFKT